MDYLLTRFEALDQDEVNAADLCYRSGSGIGVSCVPSTHVKDQTSLPSTRWVPPPKPNHSIQTNKHSMSPKYNHVTRSVPTMNSLRSRPNLGRGCGKRRVLQRFRAQQRSTINLLFNVIPRFVMCSSQEVIHPNEHRQARLHMQLMYYQFIMQSGITATTAKMWRI